MRTGIIGGRLGYRLLRRLGARTQATASCTGSESFEAVPIRRVRSISRWLPREFFTSFVRCTLSPANPAREGAGVQPMAISADAA